MPLRLCTAAAEADGLLHISEQSIIVGSAIISIAGPMLFSASRGSRVEQMSPADVPMILDANTKILDIRTRAQILAEGIPFKETSARSCVIEAPWFVNDNGRLKRNDRFEQDVVFSHNSLVNERTTFIILDSEGELSKVVAKAVGKLSNHHDIYVVTGGFKAWKTLGLPYCFKHGGGMGISGSMGGATSLSPSSTAPTEILVDSGGHKRPIFRPKIVDVMMEGYTLDNTREDVLGGLVVGVIALSLSMALGIASESTPAIGLYTAVISGFLISALGGSRVSIGGPTAAFIPIVVGVSHTYGPGSLVVCTGMAGAFMTGMGVLGLGTVVKYIPKPVVTGFTAGIATFIFSTQIKDFLGFGVPGHLPEGVSIPSEFLEKIIFFASHLGGVHGPSVALGAACLVLMRFWPANWAKVFPPQIVAVVVGSLAMVGLDHGLDLHTGIETIGSHFGRDAIPAGLPMPSWPEGATLEAMPGLVYPSFTIALLAAIESLLCARVADTFIDDRHNPNTELIAQGVANIASAAFGGLPATGALARTAANVRAGGRSPVSGIVAALTVLVVMLVAAPVAQYIPLPALAAVLVVVAINMGEWRNFAALPSWPDKDAQLFLVAFLLTVLQDVAVAVEFGMVAAVILFVQDVTGSMHVRALPPSAPVGLPGSSGVAGPPLSLAASRAGYDGASILSSMDDGFAGSSSDEEADWRHRVRGTSSTRSATRTPALTKVPSNAAYLEVTGPLLFGTGDLLEEAMEELHMSSMVNAVVLDLSHVSAMDVSGLEVMEDEHKKLRKAGKHLVLCGLTRQPLRMLSRAGFLDVVGRENVCAGLQEALHRAAALAEDPRNTVNNVVTLPGYVGRNGSSLSSRNGHSSSTGGSIDSGIAGAGRSSVADAGAPKPPGKL